MANQKKSGIGVFLIAIGAAILIGIAVYLTRSDPGKQLHDYEQRASSIRAQQAIGSSTAAEDAELAELDKRIGKMRADGIK